MKVYSDSRSDYILIRENHLRKANFKEGDYYDIEFEEGKIILIKKTLP
ncbi:unnamed protein product [marine sediment metagenome]|uniref:SpoVT-AbrB domain-containing protein n=1 Tax=marine sediment metagenome TaxID=412755 RepID=X1Q392_9ZZZZ